MLGTLFALGQVAIFTSWAQAAELPLTKPYTVDLHPTVPLTEPYTVNIRPQPTPPAPLPTERKDITAPPPAPEAPATSANRYAAIAYSHTTGWIGSASNCGSRAEAEALALRKCRGGDAKVVVWARNGFCALASAGRPGAVGYAWATTRDEAENLARTECAKYTTACPRIDCSIAARP